MSFMFLELWSSYKFPFVKTVYFPSHHASNSIFQIKQERLLDFNVLWASNVSLMVRFINLNLYFSVILMLENDRSFLLCGYLYLAV